MTDIQEIHRALVLLGQQLGDPSRELVIAAEGNISHAVSDDAMLVKASGSALECMGADDLVHARLAPLLEVVRDEASGDDAIARANAECVVGPVGRRPSVEAVLHAVLYDLTSVACIAHTHPIAVNGLLCSSQAEALTAGALFPDQVVMLGRRQLQLPYVDPGLRLARAVREGVLAFVESEGRHPRVIYLRNHGMFALGASPADVLQVTQMADKAARVLSAALSVGRPVYMSPADVDRIDGREDEHYRRTRLGQVAMDGGS